MSENEIQAKPPGFVLSRELGNSRQYFQIAENRDGDPAVLMFLFAPEPHSEWDQTERVVIRAEGLQLRGFAQFRGVPGPEGHTGVTVAFEELKFWSYNGAPLEPWASAGTRAYMAGKLGRDWPGVLNAVAHLVNWGLDAQGNYRLPDGTSARNLGQG